jgi:DNA-binding CsgD family transcriptional regulator
MMMDDLSPILAYIQRLIETEQDGYAIWMQGYRERSPIRILAKGNVDDELPIGDLSLYEGNEAVIENGNRRVYLFRYPPYCLGVLSTIGKMRKLSSFEMSHLGQLFINYFQKQQIDMKDKQIAKYMEGIRSISTSLNIDELIKNIIRNALNVIPVADTGLLHLYDPNIDRLVVKSAVGFDEERLKHFQLKVGESIAGKVYQDGRARIYYSNPEAHDGMKDLSAANYSYLNSAKELKDMKALLSVPISIGDRRIGVLVLHQFDHDGRILDEDLHLLQGFADQAAIAIQNAQLYSETKRTLEELQYIGRVHQTLTQLSLQNKGVESILSALNRMIRKSVSFLDILDQVYFPGSSVNTTSVPPVTYDEIITLFKHRNHPVTITVGGGSNKQRYYVHPVVNGIVLLGAVFIRTEESINDLDRITIEQGISVLTLELVKRQAITTIFYKQTHQFFQELLTNKDPKMLMSKGKEFGLDRYKYYTVILFQIASQHDLQKIEACTQRLIAKINHTLINVNKIVYGFNNMVTLLVTSQNPASKENYKALCKRILDGWNNYEEATLFIGIGNNYQGLEMIRKSYDEAKKAITFLSNRQRDGIAHYEDLGIYQLIANLSQEEIEVFVNEVLAPLQQKNARKSDLEQTLLLYMSLNQSAQQTAEQLHIHINTLYQRLRKIEELLGIQLKNPEDMLKIQLACYLRTLDT